MPRNPFDNGNRTNRAAAAQSRALERAAKSLEASMRGQIQTQNDLTAARSVSTQRHLQELESLRKSLGAQQSSLRDLDAHRAKYHDEEMKRSSTLLQRYETIKQALKELQEDFSDTSTIVGSFMTPFREGTENMLKFGELPKVSRGIRDLDADFGDLGGTASRAAGQLGDFGSAALDVLPAQLQYKASLDDLDVSLNRINTRVGGNIEETRKMARTFTDMARIDIVSPGAVAEVEKVTETLKFLELQGLDTGDSMRFVTEQSRRTGKDFSESAEDLEVFSAQSTLLHQRLGETNNNLKGLTFTVRTGFIQAMQEATRNLTSQTHQVEAVGSAYVYAASKMADYGLAAKGIESTSKAFGDFLFTERQDANTFLAGGEMSSELLDRFKELKDSGQNTPDIEAQLAREWFGVEDADSSQLEAIRESLSAAREGGLGQVDVANMLMTTEKGIESRLNSLSNMLSGTDTSTHQRLLQNNFGVNLETFEARRFSRMMQEGRGEEVAKEIAELRQDSERLAQDPMDLAKDTVSALKALNDPVQTLFNIKDYVKSIALNMSNMIKLVQTIPGVDELTNLYNDFTGEAQGRDTSGEIARLQDQEKESTRNVDRLVKELQESDLAVQRARESGNTADLKQAQEAFGEAFERHNAAIMERASTATQIAETAAVEQSRDSLPDTSILTEMASEAYAHARSSMSMPSLPEMGTLAAFANPVHAAATSGLASAARLAEGVLGGEGGGRLETDPNGNTWVNLRLQFQNFSEAVAYHTLDQRLNSATD